MICSFTTLHVNDDGYVIKCDGCKNIQVAFGTTALIFTDQEYSNFCKTVDHEISNWHNDGFPSAKSIFVLTKSNDITLVFSYNEIEKLQHILVSACLILQVEKIINGNETNQFS